MSRLLRSFTYRLTDLLIRWLLRPVLGQKRYQPLFAQLLQVALRGLNYGAWDFRTSGELAVLEYVRDQLARRGESVWQMIDVGGNVGDYASQLLAIMAPHPLRLDILEPAPSCLPVLRAKFAGQPGVQVHALGLGSASGSGQLFYDHEQSGLASVYPRGGAHLSFRLHQQAEITLTTLDQFCSEQHISHIHFLKLDVEGHELAVLQGARDLLHRGAIDFIQFEFGGANLDARTRFQDFYYLLQPDFAFFRVVKDGLWPLDSYHETDDIPLTINFLAQCHHLPQG
jgi:FkbM family methyltransferase